MHGKLVLYTTLLASGCAGGQWSLPRDRPPANPEPRTVQEEIRDARYFLAYPDESAGPSAGLQPRDAGRPPSSQ